MIRRSSAIIWSDLPRRFGQPSSRPQVLLKYKADSDKYALEEAVSCRGAWHLQVFDINEADQVHTYLKYLGDLPYGEQLHWKQYSHKAPIGAGLQDRHQRRVLRRVRCAPRASSSGSGALHDLGVPWWKMRVWDQIGRTHYPSR